MLRKGADTLLVHANENLIARLELRHCRTGLNHDTGKIVTQDQRKLVGQSSFDWQRAAFRYQLKSGRG